MSEAAIPSAVEILIDADACPVKDECYKVAARHDLQVFLVANRLIQAPRHPKIERVLTAQEPDAADDWIAARADARTIVVTADIPLADRCVKAGASVIAPNGKIFEFGLHRHGAGDAQSDGGSAFVRRGHGRPERLFAARPLGLSVSAGASGPASQARRCRERKIKVG